MALRRVPARGLGGGSARGEGPCFRLQCFQNLGGAALLGVRRAYVVHGRLYLRMREEAWFICAFEPSDEFADIQECVRNDFRKRGGESPDLESAYDRLQELQLVLYPGDGGRPVTEAIIQVEGDTAYFRY